MSQSPGQPEALATAYNPGMFLLTLPMIQGGESGFGKERETGEFESGMGADEKTVDFKNLMC